MVAYSFKMRFVAPILAGTKRQTIRPRGAKRHARPGDEVQIYTAMRTKQCRKWGAAICEGVSPIAIHVPEAMIKLDAPTGLVIFRRRELDDFATLDGFRNWDDMREFWMDEHDAPDLFEGLLITWRDFQTAAPT